METHDLPKVKLMTAIKKTKMASTASEVVLIFLGRDFRHFIDTFFVVCVHIHGLETFEIGKRGLEPDDDGRGL